MKLLLKTGLILVCLISFIAMRDPIKVEFCSRGSKGVCATKTGGGGFACVYVNGSKDCGGSFETEL